MEKPNNKGGLQFPFRVLEAFRDAESVCWYAEKEIKEWATSVGITIWARLYHAPLPRKLKWKDADGRNSQIDAWSSGGLYTRVVTEEWDSANGHHARVATLRIRTYISVPELGIEKLKMDLSFDGEYITAGQIFVVLREVVEGKAQSLLGLRPVMPSDLGESEVEDWLTKVLRREAAAKRILDKD